MGKYLSLIIGGVVALLGLIFLIIWWFEFVFFLKGVIPFFLLFCGVIAVLAGVSEFKDSKKEEK